MATPEVLKLQQPPAYNTAAPDATFVAAQVDVNMAMANGKSNGSIFLVASSSSAGTESGAAGTTDSAGETSDNQSLLKQIMTLPKQATNGTASCKDSAATANADAKTSKSYMQKLTGMFKQTSAAVAKDDAQITKLSKDNEAVKAKTESLTAERDALLNNDGTGSGASSAYNLGEMFEKSAPVKGEKSTTNQPADTEESPDQSKVDGLNNEIDRAYGQSFSFTKNIIQLNAKKQTETSKLNQFCAQALTHADKANGNSAKGAETAKTVKEIGDTTATVGGLAISVGTVMNTFGGAGAPFIMWGGIGTTAGGVASGTASLIQGDLKGAVEVTNSLTSTVNQYQDRNVKIDSIEKSTATQKTARKDANAQHNKKSIK